MISILLMTLFTSANCDFSKMETWVALDEVPKLRSLMNQCDLDVNSSSPSGRTLLMAATEYDALGSMQWLIQNGANVNLPDSRNFFPLHFAETPEAARLLLQAGAKTGVVDAYDRTPFQVMLNTENFELLDLMRSFGSPIRHKDIEWASNYYKFEVLKYLAERATKTEIHNSGRYFRTFFFYNEEYRQLAAKMIEKGADLNSARMISSRRQLLDFYIDEYVKDAPGYVKNGLSAIKFLVENGADVHQYMRSIRPVFHHLLQKPDFASASRLVDIFLENELDINQRNHQMVGKTAVMEMASMRPENLDYSLQVAELLVAKGANVNLQDWNGRTALHWAIRWANTEFVKLLNPIIDKNLRDAEGKTALEYAYDRFESGPAYHRKELSKIIKILRN